MSASSAPRNTQFDNPTILILTDCNDLDKQITTTFQHIDLPVQQATSVAHLDKILRNDYGGIITSTLQKFQQTGKNATTDKDTPDEDRLTRTEWHIIDNLLIQTKKALQDGK